MAISILSHEVDYKILEQDYEDEFEASQIIDKPTLDPSFLDEDAPTIEELTEEKEDS